ncbi:MAG: DNA-3-methyladenine glycosylase 2 family protein [Planctomycetota bacterium]|nr:DNA-3-methyladenine glycosylase 2 family protein [Planctomycetota bacterium]
MTAPSAAQMRALARRDPALGRALKRLPPFPGFPTSEQRRLTHYEYLARAIVYQQVAGAAARTIWQRARAMTPGPRFPRPAELLAFSDARLRKASLSRQKAAALRDLAARVDDRRLILGGLGHLSDQAIVERLTTVRGIGPWSAQMLLLFRLGRLDVLPHTDLAIQEGLRRLDGLAERPRPSEVLARGERWRPLASVAAWGLWRLSDD